MEFPAEVGPRYCLVEGYSGRAVTRTAIRVKLWHRQEVNLPHPCFPLCDILVPWRSLNGMHRHTAQCKRVAEKKRRRLSEEEEEEEREVTSRAFSAYGCPL